jgi:hypothetical protein
MPKDISKSTPKTVLDKIVAAAIKLGQPGGSSRAAISKALADEYGAAGPNATGNPTAPAGRRSEKR